MQVVAQVHGVQIVFYANEHPPPHFHAKNAEHQAVIDIETLSVTECFLPIAKRRRVLAWAATRQDALHDAFLRATSLLGVERIA